MNEKKRIIEISKQLIKNAKKIVFFTGAGISAESKIPTFRGSSGTYTKSFFNMVGAATIGMEWGWKWFPNFAFKTYKSYFLDPIIKAQPNKSHYSIVDLYLKKKSEKKEVVIVTTNVDGLHKRACKDRGVDIYSLGEKGCKILEIHGNTFKFKCMDCSYIVDNIPKNNKCKKIQCKGYLRPDVVFFGENIKASLSEVFSFSSLDENDLLIIIGSSGIISRNFPEMIKRFVPVIEINIDPEPKFGNISDKHIYLIPENKKTGELMEKLIQ